MVSCYWFFSVSCYELLRELADFNAKFFNNLQFTMREEKRSRPLPPPPPAPTTKPSADMISIEELRRIWPEYYRLIREQRQHILISNTEDLIAAPHDVKIHDTITVDYNGASYAIEVMTWQALPGMYIPATLYRPLNIGKSRLPVVLQENVVGT